MAVEAIYNDEMESIANFDIFIDVGGLSDVVFVLIENGAVVAFADAVNLLSIDDDTSDLVISACAVRTGMRGRGYGKSLITALQARFSLIELREVLPEAVGFWRKMGFHDEDEDEGLMRWTR